MKLYGFAILALAVGFPTGVVYGQSALPTPTRPPKLDDKPKGIAEKAPDELVAPPTDVVLSTPKEKNKVFELVQLNGYFRFRADWLKNFHLGFDDTANFDPTNTTGGAPFPRALACGQGAVSGAPCSKNLKSSNMRLRLEPVIHINEFTSVHIQADVFDNLVLGSTAAGSFGDGTARPGNIPVAVSTDNQVSPRAGVNSNVDSIQVKRVWAEAHDPGLGVLRIGRQPSHWGMGILANAGGYDPIHGTYDLDADFGDTVDRLQLGTRIPGTDFQFAFALDWAATGPSAAQNNIFRNRSAGQPWDLDDRDDVNQYTLILSRIDPLAVFNEKVASGHLAINYGFYFVYRTQGWESTSFTQGEASDASTFVKRSARAYIPDVWLRMAYGNLSFEFEGVAVLGSIDNLEDQAISESLSLRQLGAVGRLGYKAFDKKLDLSFELGYASGDQWDNVPQGATHINNARGLPECTSAANCDDTISAFQFDQNFNVDLILFRELLGAVTNATYVKQRSKYNFTKNIHASLQGILSFANVQVSTPGNAKMYGLEFDADFGYDNGTFFTGLSYGVLFPFGALNHPEDTADAGGPGFGFGSNSGSAGNAQTFQYRLVMKF